MIELHTYFLSVSEADVHRWVKVSLPTKSVIHMLDDCSYINPWIIIWSSTVCLADLPSLHMGFVVASGRWLWKLRKGPKSEEGPMMSLDSKWSNSWPWYTQSAISWKQLLLWRVQSAILATAWLLVVLVINYITAPLVVDVGTAAAVSLPYRHG